MKKTFILSCLLLVVCLTSAFAQIQDPVQFKTELKKISETEAQIIFTGTIDAGWHVYSTDLPEGGPISATFNTDKMEGIELDGKLTPQGKEIQNYDKMFEMNVRYFEDVATFVQKLKITATNYFIEGYFQYGSCNDENCLPPTDIEFSFSGNGSAATASSNATSATEATAPTVSANVSTADYWTPVIDKLNTFGEETAEILKRYLQYRETLEIPKEERALFISSQGKRMMVRAMQYLVKKYAKVATPLKKITPHKLRSTYGTNLYNETKDIYIVAEVLGHKDVNTTKKHYAGISDDVRKSVAGKVKLK